jgi:hypothetical protein
MYMKRSLLKIFELTLEKESDSSILYENRIRKFDKKEKKNP